MKRLGTNWLLVLCSATALAGCGSSNGGVPTGSGGSNSTGSGGSSGSGGSTGSGGSSGGDVTEVTITPDPTGWVDADADGNSLKVQGSWYPYGDQYGPLCGDSSNPDPKSSGMKCNDSHFGAHDPSMMQCSVITEPDPSMMSFPNDGGNMCTKGTIAKVINSTQGTGPDYSNIWGAGIGLDLAAMKDANACDPKGVFPGKDKHVIGIKFDIDMVPSVGLRVEFPMPATDGTKNGSDYWGANSSYPNSPVVQGTNTIYFDPMALGMPTTVKGVTPAGSSNTIPFDANQIESIQFHVPAATTSAYPADYEFCISNLKFLVQGTN